MAPAFMVALAWNEFVRQTVPTLSSSLRSPQGGTQALLMYAVAVSF